MASCCTMVVSCSFGDNNVRTSVLRVPLLCSATETAWQWDAGRRPQEYPTVLAVPPFSKALYLFSVFCLSSHDIDGPRTHSFSWVWALGTEVEGS
jgi:hypothetical protein